MSVDQPPLALSDTVGEIKPIRCLSQHGIVTAARLEIASSFDNLRDLVRFGYIVYDDSQRPCLSGEVELRGETEYLTWDATRLGAYRIVAQKLQLELA